MKNILFLSGYACKPWIWNDISSRLNDNINVTYLEWPGNLIKDFSKVKDFALWLNEKINTKTIVVGHSMGGLVALELANINRNITDIYLVESFINSPTKFYQNLLMPNTNQNQVNKVLRMLKTEGEHYNKDLIKDLRELNEEQLVLNLSCKITAIYGNRGQENNKAIDALNYSESVRKKIHIKMISNTCHFPMIENPNDLVRLLNLC